MPGPETISAPFQRDLLTLPQHLSVSATGVFVETPAERVFPCTRKGALQIVHSSMVLVSVSQDYCCTLTSACQRKPWPRLCRSVDQMKCGKRTNVNWTVALMQWFRPVKAKQKVHASVQPITVEMEQFVTSTKTNQKNNRASKLIKPNQRNHWPELMIPTNEAFESNKPRTN